MMAGLRPTTQGEIRGEYLKYLVRLRHIFIRLTIRPTLACLSANHLALLLSIY